MEIAVRGYSSKVLMLHKIKTLLEVLVNSYTTILKPAQVKFVLKMMILQCLQLILLYKKALLVTEIGKTYKDTVKLVPVMIEFNQEFHESQTIVL